MASSLSLNLNTKFSPLSCGDLFDVIFFLWCVCWDRWIVGLWFSLSMNNIWFFSEFFYVWLSYLCKSLWIIRLVWPTRLVVLAMGEVLSFGFNLAVSFPSDSRGSKAHIVLLPSRITRWGFYHIAWIYPSTSCHLAYGVTLFLHNTLDAC